METLISEIVQKLHSLSEGQILEVLNFVDFVSTKNNEPLALPADRYDILADEEFDAIADYLTDQFKMYVGSTIPTLSDYIESS
ncbi:hypothetical protein [Spirulina subsalsa]|uniref:hypothetical protein n=1 Tax=Spirulina subsalsa TaxID=54311 RepID=UPI0002E5588C|nr:hypothetical protein [Spirulina subsalsa]